MPLASVTSLMQDYYGEQSSKWSKDFILRIIHAILQIVVFAAGLTVGLSLGWVTSDFGNCVLYSSMTIKKDENGTMVVDKDKTDWSSPGMCCFVTYTSVCSAIYAVIWCWFYLLISDWGSRLTETGKPTDLSLLIASIVVGGIFLCLTFASAVIVTEGIKQWCLSVVESLKVVYPEKESVSCSDLTYQLWTHPYHGYRAYIYVKATDVGILLLTVCFALQTIIAAVRVKMFSSHPEWGFQYQISQKYKHAPVNLENTASTSYDANSELSIDLTSTHEFLTPCSSVAAVEVYSPTTTIA